MKRWLDCICLLVLLGLSVPLTAAHAQRLEMPRRHDRPPGPPLSAEEAVARMTVPAGFSVEIVAAEPDVVNPVAMCIDEQGRYWITESFEYPRKEPGPGRDRIKVLEDTDGDGQVDKVTLFAEGLNIPSGIAVGYGGVWVANSPDILFLQDTDGDLKADKQEVIVTGFGRTDTHELPNSFTWGPDGWLYGLNGVFNYCDVKYGESNPNFKPDHPGWKFTCAMWRIHPRTREFQIFAEGTSNPWGIAINDEGDFFISACVIDHLWHIVETGYYIRQGGPYPPHTWPIRSIVDFTHQKAAYCGITWFDSDVYPEEYRKVLYMGNIHGGCINADVIERSGSTYKGKPHPGFAAKPQAWKDDEYGTIAKTGDEQNPKLADFLTANDAWFMPVVQTTGPDGCLYILDWYDRYHCYQDANADPEGVERAKGRLYRVVYRGHEHKPHPNLAAKTQQELFDLLDAPNEYLRSTARRLLGERVEQNSLVMSALRQRVEDPQGDTGSRLRALWAMMGTQAGTEGLDPLILRRLVEDGDPTLRVWGLRLARNFARKYADVSQEMFDRYSQVDPQDQRRFHSIDDEDPRVLRQLATLIPHETVNEPTNLLGPGLPELNEQNVKFGRLFRVQQSAAADTVVKQIAWRNQLENLADSAAILPALVSQPTFGFSEANPDNLDWLSRMVDVLMSRGDAAALDAITAALTSADVEPNRHKSLRVILEGIARGVAPKDPRFAATEQIRAVVSRGVAAGPEGDLFESSATLGTLLAIDGAREALRSELARRTEDVGFRARAIRTLLAVHDPQVMSTVTGILTSPKTPQPLLTEVVESLGRSDDPHVSEVLLAQFSALPVVIQPKVIELLTQRALWTRPLLAAVAAKQIDKDALNLNQLRRIATFKDAGIQKSLKDIYGEIREGRDPNREQVFYKTRDFLNGTPGDPFKGEAVFKKVCGQCHKLYGEGPDVGPDITRNGRNNWDQLLWNLLDPSQVIGPGYQARILITTDGRTLTGLPVEESDERVVLKVQGGKQESIPRSEIELYKVSELSLMPDQLEKQLTPQELADLLSYLALDKPPQDPEAKLLPGAPSPGR